MKRLLTGLLVCLVAAAAIVDAEACGRAGRRGSFGSYSSTTTTFSSGIFGGFGFRGGLFGRRSNGGCGVSRVGSASSEVGTVTVGYDIFDPTFRSVSDVSVPTVSSGFYVDCSSGQCRIRQR